MKQWLILLFLLAAGLDCKAQFGSPSDLAFWGRSLEVGPYDGYPTNTPGYAPVGWYQALDYTTNTTPIIVDRSGYGNDLTNLAANTTWLNKVSNQLNGYPSVYFPSSFAYLKTLAITEATNSTVFMVLSVTNAGANIQYWAGIFSTNANVAGAFSTKKDLFNGSYYLGVTLTNIWYIRDDQNVIGAQQSWTNNISQGTGTSASSNMLGFVLGNTSALNASGLKAIVECIVWQTNLTADIRTNMYRYLTNKYNLP